MTGWAASGGHPHAAEVDGVDVDAAVAAIRSCPAVSDLVDGPLPTFATYLPGRRIAGLRVSRDVVGVQVCARWGTTVTHVAAQVRTALAPIAPGRRIDVTVADLDEPPTTTGAGTAGA